MAPIRNVSPSARVLGLTKASNESELTFVASVASVTSVASVASVASVSAEVTGLPWLSSLAASFPAQPISDTRSITATIKHAIVLFIFSSCFSALSSY